MSPLAPNPAFRPPLVAQIVAAVLLLAAAIATAAVASAPRAAAFPSPSDEPLALGTGAVALPGVTPVSFNLTKTYDDLDNVGITFRYPEEFRPHLFHGGHPDVPPELRSVLTVQSASGEGFQIAVSAFDEPAQVMTRERVRAELPDLVMQNARTVTTPAGGRGLAFQSDNAPFGGETTEVWFVHRDHLYQITTTRSSAPLLQAVLATLRFSANQ